MTCEEITAFGREVSNYTGEWECPCPICGHPNHLHVNVNKGVYTCVTPGCPNTGAFSRIPQQMEKAPVDWRLMTEVYTYMLETGTLSKRHRKWLNSRGILLRDQDLRGLNAISSDGIIDALTSKFSPEELQLTGVKVDGVPAAWLGYDRVIIPYMTRSGASCFYARSRVVSITDKTKYLSPPKISGSVVAWGWNTVPDNTPVIGVTEGELKAQAARQAGFPFIGLPGMNAGHSSFAKHCRKFGVQKVIIVFDTEMAVEYNSLKHDNIERAARKLCEALDNAGIFYTVKWLPDLGEMKMDIDTFILRRGESEFINWINSDSRGHV